MFRRTVSILLPFAAALPLRAGSFSGVALVGVDSAYLSSSGSLCDTHPVCWQELDAAWSLGEWGYLDGYAWFQSALNDCQNDSRRMFMNEFEGTLCYNYDWQFSANAVLRTKAGGLWNPQIGYPDESNSWSGPYFVQSLDNPYLTPTVNALMLVAPEEKTRVRCGVKRSIPLADRLTLTPQVEFVWSDARRFKAKYGEGPDAAFLGGAFDVMVATLRLRYQFTERFAATLKLRQFALLGSQTRDVVGSRTGETAKTDLTAGGVCLEYAF